MHSKKKQAFRFRRTMLIMDLLMLLLAGILYGWSVFVSPLETEFGWLRSQTSLTYTLAVGANTLAGVAAAYLSRKFSHRKVIRIAAILAFSGLTLASFTQSRWQLYLGYGVFFGAASGMVYNAVLSTVVSWYQNAPTTISGFLLMGYGLSAAIFGPLSNVGIEQLGWRMTFRVLGVIMLLVFGICAQTVRKPTPEEQALLPEPLQTTQGKDERSLPPQQMLKQKSFWLFAGWTVLLAGIGMALSGHASPIAQSVAYTPAAAAVMAGLVSASNGAGRLVFGALFDRFRIKTLLLVPALAVLGAGILILCCRLPVPGLLIPAFLLLGLSFGGSPVCSTGFIKTTYGSANYSINLSIANLSVLFSAYIGPYVSGLIFERSGYGAVFTMLLLMALGAGILAMPLLLEGKRPKA